MKWQGYTWKVGERWGLMHPGKPECWYDKSAVEIQGEDLILKTHYNPKEIDGVTSPYGVGLIHCTEKFGYGRFDIDIKFVWQKKQQNRKTKHLDILSHGDLGHFECEPHRNLVSLKLPFYFLAALDKQQLSLTIVPIQLP